MKRLFQMLGGITWELATGLLYAIKINLRHLAVLVEIAAPYVMYVLGQDVALTRGYFGVGGELFIPIVFVVVAYYINGLANKCNTGRQIPIPSKRFTIVDDEGEVSIENKRLQELLLYVADLEDWMERKRWL